MLTKDSHMTDEQILAEYDRRNTAAGVDKHEDRDAWRARIVGMG